MAHLSNSLLNVPHHPQESDGYCLPACVQMVLDYIYEVLVRPKPH